ncbi:hypothetical protein [Thermodesulforhabdus norvegica]|uniref:Uncharacterized protein n=1 Tax=Thermodesulforhabdus norvegica TaxID=39841 RepID=A0A1I4QHH9_9BACT|nr:hypothetical protein [Thermodesulforhabdus norvegica]SFM39572.1 hypothetical protein SAMN05660836_00044 [Thermodesulforhabdus norvegica]
MRIEFYKNYIEFIPESDLETNSLEGLWRLLVDCVRFNKKLVPMGEYIPQKKNVARFAIEGEAGVEEYPVVIVDRDCRCYCQTCNKYVELKKGDRVPPCCGKLMEIMD